MIWPLSNSQKLLPLKKAFLNIRKSNVSGNQALFPDEIFQIPLLFKTYLISLVLTLFDFSHVW